MTEPKPPAMPKGDPFQPPDGPVSHEQLFWGMFAIKASLDDLLLRVVGDEEKQKHDSRALEKVVQHCNEIGRKVDALCRMRQQKADDDFEAHERQLHPEGPPTIPVPPPELDADERTTPGHRISVPDVDGDPGP